MEVLITGNDPRVARSLGALLCHDHKVVVAMKQASQMNLDRRIASFSLTPGDPAFVKLFESFQFHTVIFLSSRHRRDKIEQKGELDDLKQALRTASPKGLAEQFIYLSSTLVYAGNKEVNEEADPVPLGSTGLLIGAGEQLCRHFREKYALNTVVLHVPYLYGNDGCDLLTDGLLHSCVKKKAAPLPGAKDDLCDFLHEADLADLLMRLIDERYNLKSGVINASSGSAITFGMLAGYLADVFPEVKFEYTAEPAEYPLPVKVGTARQYYDWTAVRKFTEDAALLLKSYTDTKSEKESIWKRVTRGMKPAPMVIRICELILGFALVEYLNSITHTNAQFQFIDFRLLYVVMIGCTHGIRTGIFAAIFAGISYVAGYLRAGAHWDVMFFNIDNWLPIVSYFIAGAVTGYSKDKGLNRELFLKNQQNTLEERYLFLFELYNQTLTNKNRFKNQVISYRDSFGRIYNATCQLDSLQHEEVFLKAIQVMEDILDSKSAAIYTLDAGMNFARLAASSEEVGDTLANTIRLSEHGQISNALQARKIWCNNTLIENEPAYCAPVLDKGKPIAMILLWRVGYDQMTSAYLNLFKVLSGLVEASLVRAVNYQAAMEQNMFLPGTRIMVKEEFAKLLGIKKQMKENNIARFMMLKVETGTQDPVWLSNTILSCIRRTDILGQMPDGDYHILLSQADDTNAGLVQSRLSERGITCRVEKG